MPFAAFIILLILLVGALPCNGLIVGRLPYREILSLNMQRKAILPAEIPPPPKLNRASLPAMLAGGILFFVTSVPPAQRKFADELLKQSQETLRCDPTVSMELGMGIESGGVYAASYMPYCKEKIKYRSKNVDRLIIQFQINGGNVWAQGVAYGIRECEGCNKVQLLMLEVANMDAILNNKSFRIPLAFPVDETIATEGQ